MKTTQAHKSLEKSLIYKQSRDGLLDLFFGFMVLVACINGLFSYYGWEEVWYIRYLIIILLVPFLILKFLLTGPRAGYVKMPAVRGGRKKLLYVFLGISIGFTVILWLVAAITQNTISSGSVWVHPLVEFGFLVIVIGVVGWLIGAYSLLLVGLSLGLAWPVSEWLQFDTLFNLPQELFTMGIPGLLVIAYGLYRLIRYLKDHPKSKNHADYEPAN